MGVPTVLKSIAFNSYYAEIMWAFCETIDTALHRFVLSVEEESSEDFIDYRKVISDHSACAAIVLDLKENDDRVKELTSAKILSLRLK